MSETVSMDDRTNYDCSTLQSVVIEIAWGGNAAQHMLDGHGVTRNEADEALNDPDALWFEPDPASASGLSVRVVGWCASRQQLITVILLPDKGGWAGVNGWVTKSGRDRTAYRKGIT